MSIIPQHPLQRPAWTSLLPLFIVTMVLLLEMPFAARAQPPDLAWQQNVWEGTFAQCKERTPRALAAEGFRTVFRTGTRAWIGRDSILGPLTALVVCSDLGPEGTLHSQVTIVVTAVSTHQVAGERVKAAVARRIFAGIGPNPPMPPETPPTTTTTTVGPAPGCDPVWRGRITPCTSERCGGFKGNKSVLCIGARCTGSAWICRDGSLGLDMPNVRQLVESAPVERFVARNEPFEVHIGRFCGGGFPTWWGSKVADFRTDDNGTYQGQPGVRLEVPFDKEIVLNARRVSQFIIVPEQTGFMSGHWEITAQCPQGTVKLGMFVREHRTDGSFRADASVQGHPGCFEGRSDARGITMIRTFSRSQQWSGTFPRGDRSRLVGRITDPTHAPCTFEARHTGM